MSSSSYLIEDLIADALAHIDASCDREEWVRIGMAIKSELGDAGFGLFEDWSKTAPEKFNPKACRDTWKSIKSGGAITLGTLIHHAQKRGFSLIRAERKPIDHEAIQEHRRKRHEEIEAERRRTEEQYQITAEYAEDLLSDAELANPNHAYLRAKEVLPHDLRQRGSELLVTMFFGRKLVNLQRIGPHYWRDDNKQFLKGGRVTGCYALLGAINIDQSAYLSEGWATGATLFEDRGHPVACAMTAHNLLEAGRSLLADYPSLRLTVAGDDDRQTKGNPGRTAAIAAANALGCEWILPSWPADAPLHLSDFNDLRQWLKGRKQ